MLIYKAKSNKAKAPLGVKLSFVTEQEKKDRQKNGPFLKYCTIVHYLLLLYLPEGESQVSHTFLLFSFKLNDKKFKLALKNIFG